MIRKNKDLLSRVAKTSQETIASTKRWMKKTIKKEKQATIYLYDPEQGGDRIPEHLRKVIKEIQVKDGITDIPERAFEDCHQLETLILPPSVITIGRLACCSCWNLKNLILPKAGLKKVGRSAFNECRRLTEIHLPNTLETIDIQAFYYCSSLQYIKIPPLVTIIKAQAFIYCYSLQEVVFSSETAVAALQTIQMEAFLNCYHLKSINLQDCSYLREIHALAFRGCFSLPIDKMELPMSIKKAENREEDPLDCIKSNPWYPGNFSENHGAAVIKKGPGPNFGFKGKTQYGYGPEYWAISKEQLLSIEEHPLYDRKDVNGSFNFTMREFVELSIKPMTIGSGMSFSLCLNRDKPLLAKIMVSHSWDEALPEFVKPLKAYDGPFWVCSLAIYQNNDKNKGVTIAEQLGDDPSFGPFGTVLKLPDVTMKAVVTFGSDIYTRLWCVFEMFIARQNNVAVDLCPFIDTVERYFGRVEKDVCVAGAKEAVNSNLARCGNPQSPVNEDEVSIRASINASDGKFESVDKAVETIRFLYLLQYSLSKMGCNETTARDKLKEAIESVLERLPLTNEQRRIQMFDSFREEFLKNNSGFADNIPIAKVYETDKWGNVKGDHDYYIQNKNGEKVDVYNEWMNHLKRVKF